MSKYPKAAGYSRLRPNTTHRCTYRGCTRQAMWAREIQFGYMRGSDDASVTVCDEHKRIPGGDVQAWVTQFPQEAWRS